MLEKVKYMLKWFLKYAKKSYENVLEIVSGIENEDGSREGKS